MVEDYEVAQIKDIYRHFDQFNYKPKLTVIIVGKRINTRIFGIMVRTRGQSSWFYHRIVLNFWTGCWLLCKSCVLCCAAFRMADLKILHQAQLLTIRLLASTGKL
jgi:hypothetical protein